MIALIDYGAGNLASVRKGLAAAGATTFTPGTPSELAVASAIVVPGVGHFAATRPLLQGWAGEIRSAMSRGVPLLGICLGLQWLFQGSDEEPGLPGLGILAERCMRLPGTTLKVPHVGWNTMELVRASRLLEGVPGESFVYFTHSYAAPLTEACVASTEHDGRFAAVVERENVFGVQFHPEKSADVGLRILRNFVAVSC